MKVRSMMRPSCCSSFTNTCCRRSFGPNASDGGKRFLRDCGMHNMASFPRFSCTAEYSRLENCEWFLVPTPYLFQWNLESNKPRPRYPFPHSLVICPSKRGGSCQCLKFHNYAALRVLFNWYPLSSYRSGTSFFFLFLNWGILFGSVNSKTFSW